MILKRTMLAVAVAQCACMGLAHAGNAPAVDPPQEAQARRNEAVTLDAVKVTARQREERVVDIPESIQAFTGDALESAGVVNAGDLARITPNYSLVEAQQPGVVLINVRGIGQVRNGEAPIAMVVDGVQSSIANQITQEFFDIERVEVLKGPQGSIYGRNAIGGAINIVTRQPTNEFEGKVTQLVGNGGDLRTGFNLSGPIVEDKLLFRLAGRYRSLDGFVRGTTLDQELDEEKAHALRANLLYKPSDAFSLSLIGTVDSIDAGAAYYAPYFDGDDINKPKPIVMDRAGRGTRDIRDFSMKMDWTREGYVLTSITGRSSLESFLDEDLEWTEADMLAAQQTIDNRAWSQEFRVLSTGEGPLQWQGGVYYLATDRDTFTQPILMPGSAHIKLDPSSVTDDNQAYALFGQLSYRFSEALEGTVGMRYDVDRRRQADNMSGAVYRARFSSLQPKFSLMYGAGDDKWYATIGKGFRSGGFNPNDAVTRQYEQEELWNYEVGYKASLLGGKAALNASAFYTDIRDKQVYALDVVTVSQIISNPIPESHVKGIELEFAYRPVPQWQLGATLGLQRSRIDRYDPTLLAGTAAAGDFTGNHLNQVPGVSYTLSSERSWTIGGLEASARIDVNGSGGDYYWEVDNKDKRAARTLTNIRLGLKGYSWSLGLFVDNVFDKRYVVEFVPWEFSGGATDLGSPSRPRRYGIEFAYYF